MKQKTIWIAEAVVLVLTVLIDRVTKLLAVQYLKPIATFPLIEDVLHLTYAQNTGAAFSMLKDHRWVFMVTSSVAIVLILVLLVMKRNKINLLAGISLAMIAGGGIGNMIDRVMNGFVVDFIDFRLINFAVFNGADSFVCVGVFLLVIEILFLEKEEKEPNQNDHSSAGNN